MAPVRNVRFKPSMHRTEAARMLGANTHFSGREVNVKFKILALKYHTDKWRERRVFAKGDGEEAFKVIVSAYDALK